MGYTLISLRRKNQKLLKVGRAEREVPKSPSCWALNFKQEILKIQIFSCNYYKQENSLTFIRPAKTEDML